MSQSHFDGPKVGIDAIDDSKAAIHVSGGATGAMGLNPKLHARVLRKLDWHLLPLVSLLYFLSFLWVMI
ncbi:hypothetical protein JVT61DRAFT_1017 [Boletus reticuloceps]|uniref:Uncharacterized protein n=1 Tax=Boletus reticuloceps TaxID=495285 RepID=A0A8I2YSF5_9AGAM|nr:hypothetical protein JVT61DRAFT_1017 [Boletus reticuloceps]